MDGHTRNALTMAEVMVSLAVVAVVLGLSFVGIQQSRDASRRMVSTNNVRQLLVAVDSFAATRNGRLPALRHHFAIQREGSYGNFFLAILPHIDQGVAFDAYLATLNYDASTGPDGIPPGLMVKSDYRFSVFESPNDPTIRRSTNVGPCSYAVNAEVVCDNAYENAPHIVAPDAKNEFDSVARFADGRSNTILFAEHYSIDCNQRVFSWASSEAVKSTAASGIRSPSFAFLASDDVVPLAQAGVTRGSKPGRTFQVSPQLVDCDPSVPQGLQRAGLLIGLADGSVRLISQSVNETVFWGAVTPQGGEPIPQW